MQVFFHPSAREASQFNPRISADPKLGMLCAKTLKLRIKDKPVPWPRGLAMVNTPKAAEARACEPALTEKLQSLEAGHGLPAEGILAL